MGRNWSNWRPAQWQHLRPLPDDLTAAACGAEAGRRNLVCVQALQEQPKKAWVHTRSGSSSSLPVTVRASSPTWEEWYKWFAPSKLSRFIIKTRIRRQMCSDTSASTASKARRKDQRKCHRSRLKGCHHVVRPQLVDTLNSSSNGT